MTMPPNISESTPSLSQLRVAIGGIQKLSLVDYPGPVSYTHLTLPTTR